MTFVRAIVNDLVERKLWPVALLLVVALVATPVVLGRGAGEAADTAATQPATSPSTADDETSSLAEVTLDEEEAPARRDRGGDTRNPFKRPASAEAKTAAEETTPVPTPSPTPVTPDVPVTTGGGSTSGDTTSGGSTSGGSTSGGSPSSTPKAKTTHHVTLRFGTTGNQRTIRDIPRLAPLPSVTDPFFVYLGVLEDGKTAVFMVSADAAPTGDGKCKPSAASCQTIEMKADTTEWFDFTNPDGTVVQYQMDLVSIRKRQVSSVDAVRAAYARHSKIGAEILRDAAVSASAASKGAKRYRYLPKRGVLVRAKTRKRAAATATAGALVPGASEAVGLAPRKKQPGVAVWHWDAGKAER